MKTSTFFIGLIILAVIVSCNTNKGFVTQSKLNRYADEMGLPHNVLYRLTDSLQPDALAKGQPNLNVYNKKFTQLHIGTCYMELPFFIDSLLVQKKIVNDTMVFYQKNPTPIKQKMKEIIGINGNKAGIDPSKKYYVFYHYGMYAKEFDSKVIPGMYNKYKDSVQFFFINTDKFNSK